MPPPGCAPDAYKLFVGNVPKSYTEDVSAASDVGAAGNAPTVWAEARVVFTSVAPQAVCLECGPCEGCPRQAAVLHAVSELKQTSARAHTRTGIHTHTHVYTCTYAHKPARACPRAHTRAHCVSCLLSTGEHFVLCTRYLHCQRPTALAKPPLLILLSPPTPDPQPFSTPRTSGPSCRHPDPANPLPSCLSDSFPLNPLLCPRPPPLCFHPPPSTSVPPSDKCASLLPTPGLAPAGPIHRPAGRATHHPHPYQPTPFLSL